MIIGCPTEVKAGETRVALTPQWSKTLTEHGHTVMVQTQAGTKAGFTDEDYKNAGALIKECIEDIYDKAEFVVKAKELKPQEYGLLKKDQIVMSWFHLAEDVDFDMLHSMLDAGTIGIGMELIKLPDGTRPTIKPMSEIAGSLAMLEAIKYGLVDHGGSGCNRQQQHRENGSGADDLQKSVREVRVMDRVRKQKCEDCRDQRAASGSEKTVSDGAPKSAAGKYFNIMCPESAAGTLERF